MFKKTAPIILALFVVSSLFGLARKPGLWAIYDANFANAKYVDLTHAFSPTIPVWAGFGHAKFKPCRAGIDWPGYVSKGDVFEYEKHGFIATAYELPTDQYGTQLDPPAHFYPKGATIDQLPATYCIRPLVVIDVHEKVEKEPDYHCTLDDIKAWETKYGEIPEGSVVMIRSDQSKKWPTKAFEEHLPGITLDALKYLHEERHILFHGHECLDTDTTGAMIGETWLLTHNYCQAEGVANLWMVPETGALIAVGYAKPMGGTGGYARYIAICPPDWEYGVSIDEAPGAPLPEDNPLHWDEEKGMRVR
ncbi:cyclase [candidate division WOR-3 bacterium JGI_Cruoil_03_44_89]|uniref:Cyclase n=1 Tax=candidate division WOR-3 bacterium JGI_Cruoil_03_44_89 TaxID=1973748 RepID=A0A235BVY3_UNCW3|nr:MAG: cyclase [candidate division WOR-3 bacterium JGI_Cruoil_03_44_89]